MSKKCIKCGKGVADCFSELCFSCEKEKYESQLIDDILSGEVVETECEDDIFCPWCGTRHEPFDVDENYSFMDESDYETQCHECCLDFTLRARVSYTFSTRRL